MSGCQNIWGRVVRGSSCPRVELSGCRVVRGRVVPGRVVLGSGCPGVELSGVGLSVGRVVRGSSCPRVELSAGRVVLEPKRRSLQQPLLHFSLYQRVSLKVISPAMSKRTIGWPADRPGAIKNNYPSLNYDISSSSLYIQRLGACFVVAGRLIPKRALGMKLGRGCFT